MEKKLRNSGVGIIGDVPWGTHFCQFYQTENDLKEILVPYFKAGLEKNELCVWVTPRNLKKTEAIEALRKDIPDIDAYLEKGQIEIFSCEDWCFENDVFDQGRITGNLFRKLNQALANGYDGLRMTEDTSYLEEKIGGEGEGVDYEKELTRITGRCQVIALCTYSLDKCSASEILDIIAGHQFSLIKKGGEWELVENSRYKKAKKPEYLKIFLNYPTMPL